MSRRVRSARARKSRSSSSSGIEGYATIWLYVTPTLDFAQALPWRLPVPAHTHYLWFNTKKRQEIIDITDEVIEQLESSGIREGFALVSAMHIPAALQAQRDR